MEESKDIEITDSSIHSKGTSQPADTATKHDVENEPGRDDDLKVEDPEKVPKDPNIVDWDGPDDLANPMNWPSAKKVTAVGLVSLITMLSSVPNELVKRARLIVNSPLASTVISPASADVLATFHSTNETLGTFVTTVYLLGYVFGPLFIAPLSEIYGRAIFYNICNTIFLIFSIACAVANNLGALIVFRFLAGIASSCPIALGAGTIADMVRVEKRGLALSAWTLGPLLGPSLGPLGRYCLNCI